MSLRRHDWEARLHAWAESRQGMAFEFGRTDCAILALEAWDALTGAAIAAEFRGVYATAFGALRLMAEQDTDIARKWRELGAVEAGAGFEQRGDLIVVPGAPHDGPPEDEAQAFGLMPRAHVCMGPRSLSAAPETGVAWFETARLLDEPGALVLRCP